MPMKPSEWIEERRETLQSMEWDDSAIFALANKIQAIVDFLDEYVQTKE